ncbi:MAG: hypothetical protein P0Y60_16435 [Candidatus Microbacterium colombiense]|nr:MAG: hypothetical protein P0Y60_16435 [Microbacterium sp.]
MDNGSIMYGLFVIPFWLGIAFGSIVLVFLAVAAVNILIRVTIDGFLAARRDRIAQASVETGAESTAAPTSSR